MAEDLNTLLARAQAKLSIGASTAAKARIEVKLKDAAARLALEWMTGAARFDKMGQHTEYWLAALYEELFPDEQPDATAIYRRFGLPLSSAQYVARLIRARRSAHWVDVANKEALSALTSIEKEARTQVKAKSTQTQYKLSLSKGGFDELTVLYDRAAATAKGDRPTPPSRTSATPSLVFLHISAETVVFILDAEKS